MPENLTETVARLERLLSKATPGPYSILERGGMGYDVEPMEEGARGSFEYRKDAELVTEALNALSQLIAAAKERDAYRTALQKIADTCPSSEVYATQTVREYAREVLEGQTPAAGEEDERG